jgi:hypothetical protein
MGKDYKLRSGCILMEMWVNVLCRLLAYSVCFESNVSVYILLQCRVIAVLDWELSTFGHPLTDLAHLSLFYYWPRTLPMINRGSHIPENTGTEEQSYVILFIIARAKDIICLQFYEAFVP